IPTLGIIDKREAEIRNFLQKKYYGLQLKTKSGLTLSWHDSKNNTRIFEKEEAKRLYQKLESKAVTIQSVEKKHKKQYAPQLYDLTELQRDANRILGFSGKQTLRGMQQLYGRHKVLTYPRTLSKKYIMDKISIEILVN